MRKLIAPLLLLCMAVCSQTLHAEGKSEGSPSFWEKLRAKVEQLAPQKKMTATTAVGGVRGANMASDDVYWKGEHVAQTIDADELEAFNKALALATAGEHAKAQIAFADFATQNPDSPLRKDADQALAQLQDAK
jgi:TolA-binding protein